MALAVGLASGIAEDILDALCSSVAWSEPASFNVKLHTAIPGAAGTNAPAGETTRKLATFSAATPDGAITTTGALAWTNVSTTETYSHVSFWSDISAGNFLGSAALTVAKAVTAGDNFTIPTGDLDLTLTPIATT